MTVYAPGTAPNQVIAPDGTVLTAPDDWELVPPGDPALTRRLKAGGEHWVVQKKKGRKVFTLGVWASRVRAEAIRADLENERATEGYAKRLAAGQKRREAAQEVYVEDFRGAVITFLDFHASHQAIAERLATLVAEHATPVGSGTVARTQRIPIEQRAEAAVIAWMRHQTTAYDSMRIPRVKGERREVRRMLAARSREVLQRYRDGHAPAANCPLAKALK